MRISGKGGNYFNWIFKYETLIFGLVSVVNVIPFFLLQHIPSLDGPQHLYTSEIIVNLINSDGFITQFFKINPVPVGNWTGHLILSFYNYFLPSALAEKLLVSTYYIAIAFAFRYLVISLRGKSTLLTFFIFPFSSTTLILLGYYNYSFGTVFLFIALGYLFGKNRIHNLKFYIILAILQLCIYFSHVMVYMFFGLIVIIIFTMRFISITASKENRNKSLSSFFKHIGFIFTSALPSLILWVIYLQLAVKLGFNQVSKYSFRELTNFIFDIRSTMAYNASIESVTSHYLFFTLIITMAVATFYRIYKSKKPLTLNSLLNTKDVWLLCFAILVTIYYLFPDVYTTGNITNRISIVMFFILILWIALQKTPAWFNLLVALAIVSITIQKKEYLFNHNKNQNKYISELEELEHFIDPHTFILPLNQHEFWDFIHYPCYLGNEKPIVNFANPQLAGQFPVVWNWKDMPMVMFGSKNHHQLPISWASAYPENGIVMIDYALVCNPNIYFADSTNMAVVNILNKFYTPLQTTSGGTWQLYGFAQKEKLKETIEIIKRNEDWYTKAKEKAIKSKLPDNVMVTLEALWMIEKGTNNPVF